MFISNCEAFLSSKLNQQRSELDMEDIHSG